MDALQMANDQLIHENGGLQMSVVQAKKDLEAYKQRHHALREQYAQQEKVRLVVFSVTYRSTEGRCRN